MTLHVAPATSPVLDRPSALFHHPGPWSIPAAELQALQMRWLAAWFQEHRDRIPVLKRTADRKQIHALRQPTDIVPLLFSHDTYKSYPESFLEGGRWDRMTQWLGTLTSVDVRGLDLTGVTTLDGWLAALDAQGFAISHSSGTTGKPSFLPKRREEDAAMIRTSGLALWHGAQRIDPDVTKLPVLCGMFRDGWNSSVRLIAGMARAFAPTPDAVIYAFDEVLSPAEVRTAAKMKLAMAQGDVSPEVQAFGQAYARKQQAMAEQFGAFVRKSLTYKGQRVVAMGQTVMLFQAAQKGLAAGLQGLFASDSLVLHGGGAKGFALPADAPEVMARYYGVALDRVVDIYAMTEKNSITLSCELGRKHVPPWEMPLVLDVAGERLLNPAPGQGGVVTGRYAFADLLADSYWGGVITGDQVTVDFDGCACGRQGPVFTAIARYADLPGDDKISCSVEMAGYVRAELGVWAELDGV